MKRTKVGVANKGNSLRKLLGCLGVGRRNAVYKAQTPSILGKRMVSDSVV